MDLSYLKSRFISVIRAFGFPTQFLLRYSQFVIQPIKMLWISDLFPITGSNQTRNTHINSDFLIGSWQWFNCGVIYQQGNKPASRRIELNCHRRWLRTEWQEPRPNYVQRFWTFCQPQFSISKLKSRFGEFCRTTISFSFESRIFSSFSPEISKSFLEVPQALLQWHTANLVKKIQLIGFLPSSQQTRGLFVINSFLFFVPSFSSSSQGFVVDQTYTTHCPSQKIFLRTSGVKTIFVSTSSHAHTIPHLM